MKDEGVEEGKREKAKGGSEPQSTIVNRQSTMASSLILHPSSFIDIGAAKTEELDALLEVMCEAFEMPFAAARPVFYADPYFNLENKRVLRVEGRIVSCLTITEAECWVGEGRVKIAGIAGVATLPAYRRQGYAGHLLTATLSTLKEGGFALAGLYPFDYAYYRRFEWETASVGHQFTTSPASLPAYTEAVGVRPAVPEDLEAMARLHAQFRGAQALWMERDGRRWQYVFNRVPNKQVFVGTGGRVEGYVLGEIQPGTLQMGTTDAATPPILNVMEFCAASPEARRGLHGWLAAQGHVGQIQYVTTRENLAQAGLLDLPCPPGRDTAFASINLMPQLMLRVVDFAHLLTALRWNWKTFEGQLVLILQDSLCPEQSCTVTVRGNGVGLPDVELIPMSSAPFRQEKAETLVGNVRAWSQVVVGHVSGDDACARGLLTASTPRAAQSAGQLFPQRTPFLPAPDHF